MIGKAKVVGRPACKREETRREQGTRLGKMNAGVGDRETSRRAKERKRDENRGQGWRK